MRYGYFESQLTGYDEMGLPVFDRAEGADFFTTLWRYLLKNGVMSDPADCMMVNPSDGMTVSVSKGFCVINGCFGLVETPEGITLEDSHQTMARIDAIVVRLDETNRLIELDVKTGTPSTNPKMPDLDRDDDIYELCLATIRVEAGVTEIRSSNISDKRNDGELCGILPAITNINDKNIRVSVPSQKGSLTYNGEKQSPVWSGFDESVMDISGDLEAVEPGEYTAVFRPHEGYAWSDGSTLQKEVDWVIKKVAIQSPSFAANNFPYDEEEHTVTILNYDSTKMSKTGDESGTNAGSYSVVFTLLDAAHTMWSTTGSSATLTLKWSIGVVVEVPTLVADSYEYTGAEITPELNEYETANINVTAVPKLTVGDYKVICSLKDPVLMVWPDGTKADIELDWHITKKVLTIPTLKKDPVFTGNNVSPELNNYDSDWMTISGNSETNVGQYTATIVLADKSNTQWSDGTKSDKSIAWEVEIKVFPIPTASGNTYTGSTQQCNLKNYDTAWMLRVGEPETEVGSGYTCTVSLNNKTSTKWADGTTTDKTIVWSITRAILDQPGIRNTSGRLNFTWNGTEKDVTLHSDLMNYNSVRMDVEGNLATEVGSYVVTFTIKDPEHYAFKNMNVPTVNLNWAINKATGSIAWSESYGGDAMVNSSTNFKYIENADTFDVYLTGRQEDMKIKPESIQGPSGSSYNLTADPISENGSIVGIRIHAKDSTKGSDSWTCQFKVTILASSHYAEQELSFYARYRKTSS